MAFNLGKRRAVCIELVIGDNILLRVMGYLISVHQKPEHMPVKLGGGIPGLAQGPNRSTAALLFPIIIRNNTGNNHLLSCCSRASIDSRKPGKKPSKTCMGHTRGVNAT